MHPKRTSRAGFTLLEMVLVVVIIGMIAAIAMPRFSRGAAGATDSAVAGNLAVLRNAIDLYQAEHNGTYPTTATIAAQLTTYTDAASGTATTKDATHIYGPYVRSVPPLPVGARKSQTGIAASDASTVGWIYDSAAGNIITNTTTEADSAGKLYNQY
jgi:general secretion pathway protein G